MGLSLSGSLWQHLQPVRRCRYDQKTICLCGLWLPTTVGRLLSSKQMFQWMILVFLYLFLCWTNGRIFLFGPGQSVSWAYSIQMCFSSWSVLIFSAIASNILPKVSVKLNQTKWIFHTLLSCRFVRELQLFDPPQGCIGHTSIVMFAQRGAGESSRVCPTSHPLQPH